MSSPQQPTIDQVVGSWFRSEEFSHAATAKQATESLRAALQEAGYLIVERPKKAVRLTFHERNAAIRAYNSRARDTLERGAMVDAIVAAINEERCPRARRVGYPNKQEKQ